MNLPTHCGKQSTNSDLSETAACFYKTVTGQNGATSCLEVHPLCCSLTFTSAVFVSDAANYQISKVSPNIMYGIRVDVLSYVG